MNLFDLFEGAIDDLEARRIEDLEAKMDELSIRAKSTKDPKVKEALRHQFAKVKAERDSYYKLNLEGFVSDIPFRTEVDPEKKWKIIVRQLVADYIKNPQGLYNLAKQRGPNSPEAVAYKQIMNPTGKIEMPVKEVSLEGLVASKPSTPIDDKLIRKIVWDNLKINGDTAKEALQRAFAYLAKKPQTRMVQDLQSKLQSLEDLYQKSMYEASMNWAAHKPTGPKFGGYLKGTDPAPTEFSKKSVGSMEEGIEGNMTVRSNPLSEPLRKRNFVAKNAQRSGAGKHHNNLKAAAARGQAKHKGKAFELDEMTDDEGAKLRKDAEAHAIKQMTAPKKAEPKKSFMQQVGDKQLGMVKGAWKGLTGGTDAIKETSNQIDPIIIKALKRLQPGLEKQNGPGSELYTVAKEALALEFGLLQAKNNAVFTHYLNQLQDLYLNRNNNDVEEGWKSKLAGAALAGAAALGAGGANARVMPGDDPNINRLTGAPISQTAQADATDIKPSTPGFNKAYLQKVANGEHPRPLLSKEKAQELLKQMNADNINESLKQGEYYVWTVYFDDGSQKRIKVKSDEFDPYEYYAKKNQVVVNVDYDWSIHQ